jgi:hypothetical protein
VAGSFAAEAGDPAAGASGAMPVSATGVSMTGTRTPAVVGAEAPFGEPCPAPGPPQPAIPAAVVEDGTCGGSWGASGLPAGAPPEYVAGAAVAVAAGFSKPPAGAAGEGEDAVVAGTERLWLADPAACAAVRPAGRQPLLPAGAFTAPPRRTGPEAAASTGVGAGAGVAASGAVVAVGVVAVGVVAVGVVAVGDFATVVGAVVPSAPAVVGVDVAVVAWVVVWVVVWVVGAPVAPLEFPVVLPVACDESVVVVVVDVGAGSPGVGELGPAALPATGCSADGGADWSVAAGSGDVGSLAGVCSACVLVAVVSSACAATSPAMARPAYSPAPRKTAATARDSHDRLTAEFSSPSPPVVLAMGRTLGTVSSRHQPVVHAQFAVRRVTARHPVGGLRRVTNNGAEDLGPAVKAGA